MSGESPVVELYDSSGNPLSVQNATAIPASTPGLLSMGSDGTNSRYITIDSLGRQVVVGAGVAGTPSGGVVTIQGVASGTVVPVSGTVTANQGTANTLANAWTVEVTDGTNVLGTSGHPIRIDPTGTTTQPVSGIVTANIGTTNGLALDTTVSGLQVSQGSTTSGQKGGLTLGAVTTSAPSYTTAQTSPISLTTSGLLRIDGSGVTQPVSGTVTANIGTTNGLALDTSVNGILLSQGSTTSGEKGPLIQGAVTTSAPSYTTAQTSPLSLTTAGALRIDGSAVTQPVSGTVTANQGGAPWSQNVTQFGGTNISTGTGASGTGIPRVTVANDSNILATQSGSWTVTSNQGTANTLANAWSTKITDATNGPAAVKAASTAAAATDPALVVAISPNNTISVSTASGTSVQVGFDTLLFNDAIEGITVNTWAWTTTLSTMTITQNAGVIFLNANNTLTSGSSAILVSNKQFQFIEGVITRLVCRAKLSFQTNAVTELGFGSPPTGTGYGVNYAIIKVDATGTITAIISSNTTVITTNLTTISNGGFYQFTIEIRDYQVRFKIETPDGVAVSDVVVPLALTTFSVFSQSHLSVYTRVFNSSTVSGTAAQISLTKISVYQSNVDSNKPWGAQLSGIGHSSNINPTTFAQNTQLAVGSAPTTLTPVNTSVAYSTLGGEFSLNGTASSENLLGVFGFQSPSPYTLFVTGIFFPPPVITTSLGATINIQEWCLMINASSSNPSTATGFRNTLGIYSAAASATAGTIYNGQTINIELETPLVILPGNYILVLVKLISGSAAGVYRGSMFINGYFE